MACVPPEGSEHEVLEDGTFLDLEGCWVHQGSVLPTGKFQQADEVRVRFDTFDRTVEWFYKWQTVADSCTGLYQKATYEREVDSLLTFRSIEQEEICGDLKTEVEPLPQREFVVRKTSRGFQGCFGDCLFQSDQMNFESVICGMDFPIE